MALSQQTIQNLIGFLEHCMTHSGLHKEGVLHLCHHDLIREWNRREHEQFKTRAQRFSRRYKQSRGYERAGAVGA